MTTLTHDTARPSTFDGFAPQTISRRLGDWMQRRRKIARIEFELSTYSDRELADLGLMRSDIPDVARGQLYRG